MNHFARFLLLAGLAWACGTAASRREAALGAAPTLQPTAYDLAQPDARHDLPKALREVSGLTFYKGTQLACVQDERGEIYRFDYQTGRVEDPWLFGPAGDYEGIEFVDGTFYVLRSDGRLFVVREGLDTFRPGGFLTNGHRTLRMLAPSLPDHSEVEGLGYDPRTGRLLLAIKEIKGEKKRYVYFYDLKKSVAWKGLVLSPQKLADEAGLTGKEAEMKPSGVAVHPRTGDLYLLASDGKKLLVLDRLGIIRSVARLDPKLFRQPEGICFAPDGTLFIASEGKGGAGYILTFAEKR
jgi:uncharacterized protein YjiK